MVKRKGNRKKALLRKADTQEVGCPLLCSWHASAVLLMKLACSQIEEEIVRQQHEAQRGTAVRQMPDEQLFFEDKVSDDQAPCY